MIRHFLGISLLAIGLVTTVSDAIATTPKRIISTAQARGNTNLLPTIQVWAGSGTNLSFLPTGERIEKVWIDDPSRITLDFDRPLCQRNERRNCAGASVIHLRRINPIVWKGLPRTETTLLTVITTGAIGQQLYQFRITYGTGTPQYSTVEIQSDTTISGHSPNLKAIDRGLQVALRRRLVTPNSPLVNRIKQFLTLAQNGADVSTAAQRAGVSPQLINKLIELSAS